MVVTGLTRVFLLPAVRSTSVHVLQSCTCGRRTQTVAAKCHVRLTAACDALDSRQFPFVLGPFPSVCTSCIPQWCIAIALFSQAPNDADAQTYCLQCTSASSELGCAVHAVHCLTLTHQLRDHTNTFPTVARTHCDFAAHTIAGPVTVPQVLTSRLHALVTQPRRA